MSVHQSAPNPNPNRNLHTKQHAIVLRIQRNSHVNVIALCAVTLIVIVTLPHQLICHKMCTFLQRVVKSKVQLFYSAPES